MPTMWPNTNQPVTSFRIFKAWQSDWTETDKHLAWQHVADYTKSLNAKALVGTQISCSEASDDADWADVLALLKMLGPEHVMGVSIGNEIDLLWQNAGVTADCVQNMWQGGYLQKKFVQRIQSIDALDGFQGVQIPVTTILSEYSLAGTPFVNDPAKAMVNTFLTQMTAAYKSRFVFSFNNYPYFDSSNKYLTSANALARDTCFKDENTTAGPCLFPDVTKNFRKRMQLLNSGDNKLWVAETGWSSPVATTLPEPVKSWPEFSSASAFRTTYENFLSWDMTLNGIKGPDHVFYFTMRDAPAFGGSMEGFGLIGDELGDQKLCAETKCKIQNSKAYVSV